MNKLEKYKIDLSSLSRTETHKNVIKNGYRDKINNSKQN